MKSIILLLGIMFGPLTIAAPLPTTSTFQLSDAENAVLETDPRLLAAQSRVDSSLALVTAEGQLPDPQLRLTLLNLPTDSFDFDQEPMTQAFAGLKQSFLPGKSLTVKKAIAEARVKTQKATVETVRAQVLRELRQRWLNVYASNAELQLLNQERQVLNAMIPAATGAYRAGKGTQTEVVKIRLKLATLEEHEAALNGQLENSLASLKQWFPSPEHQSWPQQLPEILTTSPPRGIENNPEIIQSESRVRESEEKVELIRETYKPDWSIEAGYGLRESRADFLSLGVTVSLPLFTSQRQNPRLNASQSQLVAEQLDRKHLILSLNTQLQALQADISALSARIKVYENNILPEIRRVQILAKNDFRSGKTDFSDVLAAEEAILKADRKKLLLTLERARKIIDSRFLSGESYS